jgi:hypothetical protein
MTNATNRALFCSRANPRASTFCSRASTLALAALFIALCAWPQRSHAFSNPEQFANATELGGGGGRFFTASPADGYGCNVCHRGGAAPVVQVSGLPIDGYQPGVPYTIEISWTNPKLSHALQLELLGQDGSVPGQVVLLDQTMPDARAHCGGIVTNELAAYERVVGTRKILGVKDCSAEVLRFRFTPANVPELAFSASVVTSNKSASVEGDGIINLHRVLRRVGEPAKTGDCSLALGSAQSSAWSAALLLLLLGLAMRRRVAR